MIFGSKQTISVRPFTREYWAWSCDWIWPLNSISQCIRYILTLILYCAVQFLSDHIDTVSPATLGRYLCQTYANMARARGAVYIPRSLGRYFIASSSSLSFTPSVAFLFLFVVWSMLSVHFVNPLAPFSRYFIIVTS